MRSVLQLLLALVVAFGMVRGAAADAADPEPSPGRPMGWRGDGGGQFPSANPLTQWKAGENVLWTSEVGAGHSSPFLWTAIVHHVRARRPGLPGRRNGARAVAEGPQTGRRVRRSGREGRQALQPVRRRHSHSGQRRECVWSSSERASFPAMTWMARAGG